MRHDDMRIQAGSNLLRAGNIVGSAVLFVMTKHVY